MGCTSSAPQDTIPTEKAVVVMAPAPVAATPAAKPMDETPAMPAESKPTTAEMPSKRS
jgi:hypothetical protein